jgi:PDZ domain
MTSAGTSTSAVGRALAALVACGLIGAAMPFTARAAGDSVSDAWAKVKASETRRDSGADANAAPGSVASPAAAASPLSTPEAIASPAAASVPADSSGSAPAPIAEEPEVPAPVAAVSPVAAESAAAEGSAGSEAPPAAAASPVGPVAASSPVAASTPAAESSPAASSAAPTVAESPPSPTTPAVEPGAAAPTNLIATPPLAASAQNATEIPPAADSEPQSRPPAEATTEDSQVTPDDNDVAGYEAAQEGRANAQQMRDLRDFLAEGSISSPIGVDLREARRRLDSGEEADGLLVMDVASGSPAARAGLHGFHRTTHNVLTGAALAAAMVFPPAILVIPALDYAQVGESYDMIIGVDGVRVTNLLDFQDRMRDLQPGELVYLSVVRDGKRIQFRIPVPPGMLNTNY